MTEFVPPVKNDASGYIFYVALNDAAVPGSFKANPTLAAGDVKISLDGAAFGNLGTLPVVTPAAGVAVKVTLSQTEINCDNVFIAFIDQTATKEWTDAFVNFQTAARHIADLAFPATSGRSMVVDAAGLVDATVVKVGPTGAGTAQTAGDIMADTNDIQTRLPAALVGGRIDASVGAVATTTNLGYSVPAMGRGTVAAGASATSIPTSAFSPAGAVAEQFRGRVVLFDATTTTTALRGCARSISASSNAPTPTFTVDLLPAVPAIGDTFSVI